MIAPIPAALVLENSVEKPAVMGGVEEGSNLM